jgi:LCP family protein required for cell wall assembly
VFCITLISISVVFGAGWLTVNSLNKPPVIPVNSVEVKAADDEPDNDSTTGKLPTDDGNQADKPAQPSVTPEGRKPLFYTFLLFGIDNSGGNLTDTMMVGAYDGENKKAYLISIPRDTKVNVEREVKKMNSAFAVGFNHGGFDNGIIRMQKEIKTLIGFVPDYYLSVDLNAFIEIVDALGGVLINVPYDMDYTDPFQKIKLRISLTEGLHDLNGMEAMGFARHRQNNVWNPDKWNPSTGKNGDYEITKSWSDYYRIENQHQVIRAVINKTLQPSSILKIPEFIGIFNDNVKTNIQAQMVVWGSNQLLEVKDKPDFLETYTLPMTGKVGAPYSYEMPDEVAILELVNKTINPFIEDITADDLSIIKK